STSHSGLPSLRSGCACPFPRARWRRAEPLRQRMTRNGSPACQEIPRLAGAPQTVAPRAGTADHVAGTGTTRTANIGAWAGQTIRLRAEALDANPGSLMKPSVANVTIIRQ